MTDDARVLIMRPRPDVYQHVARIILEGLLPGPIQDGPETGNPLWSRRPRRTAGGPTLPGAPTLPDGGPSFGAHIVAHVENESIAFEQVVDANGLIAGTFGFREVPGGTSVTCSVEMRTHGHRGLAGGIADAATRLANRTLSGGAARSLLAFVKQHIDDLA